LVQVKGQTTAQRLAVEHFTFCDERGGAGTDIRLRDHRLPGQRTDLDLDTA